MSLLACAHDANEQWYACLVRTVKAITPSTRAGWVRAMAACPDAMRGELFFTQHGVSAAEACLCLVLQDAAARASRTLDEKEARQRRRVMLPTARHTGGGEVEAAELPPSAGLRTKG